MSAVEFFLGALAVIYILYLAWASEQDEGM